MEAGMGWPWSGDKQAQGVAAREALVAKLTHDGHVQSPPVAAAFRAVPRELFVPSVPLDEVYRSDSAIVTKRVQGVGVSSASAPDVVAIMLEQLDLRPGQRVLEVGAGTGYNAALMAEIVGASGEVVTIDIDQDLVDDAREHLARAGYERVVVLLGDGALGCPERAPFDRVVLTVAASDIAAAWREQLARPAGRLVLPLSLRGPQRTVAFEHEGDHLVSVSSRACSFIPLRGKLASPAGRRPIGPDGTIVMGLHAEASATDDTPAVGDWAYRLLRGPWGQMPTGVRAVPSEVAAGFGLWLGLFEERACSLWTDFPARGAAPAIPPLVSSTGRWHATLGLVGTRGLAVLARGEAPDSVPTGEARQPSELDAEDEDETDIAVCLFGGDAACAEQLCDRLREWDRRGRPDDAGLRIRAYALGQAFAPDEVAAVIEGRFSRLVVDWPPGA